MGLRPARAPAIRQDQRIDDWVDGWTSGRVQALVELQGASWPTWCLWPDFPSVYDALAVTEAWWALSGYTPTRVAEIDIQKRDAGLWTNLHLVGDVALVPAEVMGAVWTIQKPVDLETLASTAYRYLRDGVPRSHLARGGDSARRVLVALRELFEDVDQMLSPQAEPLRHLLAPGRGLAIPTRNSEVFWWTTGWQS
jgi:hypothetical protein